MQGDGVVQVALGRAHAQRHSESLQHLVRAQPDDVHPDHLLPRAHRDQFHGGLPLARRECVVHGCESAGVDLHGIAVFRPGLGLGQADGPDRRVAEDHGRYLRIVEPTFRLAAKQAVGQPAGGGDRHRRQRRLAVDVAHGVDAGHAGVLEFVGGNVAFGIGLDPGRLEIQTVGQRYPAGGPDQAVEAVEMLTVVERQAQGVVVASRDRRDLGAGQQADAVFQHLFGQHLAQHGVEAPQQMFAAQHQGDVGAERIEHAGQFHGDVAGADDGHAARLLLELEEPVGGDAQFGPRHLGHLGPAADGDADVIRGHAAAVHIQGPGIDEPGRALDEIDVGIGEVVAIPAVDAGHIGIPCRLQASPVETAALDIEAVAGGVFDRMPQIGREPHHLLGHAAEIHAGTTQATLLDHRAAPAVGRGPLGDRQPAAARPDGDEVVVRILVVHGEGRIPKAGGRIQNTDRIQNTEYRIQNSEFGIRNSEFGIRNSEAGSEE